MTRRAVTLVADDRLLWTCGSCGCDFDSETMRSEVLKRGKSGVFVPVCPVCGAVANLVDGPDAG